MLNRLLSASVIALTLAIPVSAVAQPAAGQESRASASDRLIADRIGEQVRRYVFYTIFDDVQGRVENGLVTLTGKVTAPYKAKEIASFVKRISGVTEVDNKLEVLPVSSLEEENRLRKPSKK
jgi:hypothetical protein